MNQTNALAENSRLRAGLGTTTVYRTSFEKSTYRAKNGRQFQHVTAQSKTILATWLPLTGAQSSPPTLKALRSVMKQKKLATKPVQLQSKFMYGRWTIHLLCLLAVPSSGQQLSRRFSRRCRHRKNSKTCCLDMGES